MTTTTALPTIEEAADLIGWPTSRWHGNCHAVSLAIIQSGALGTPGPTCRIARGAAAGYGIISQHSWIALGSPYAPATRFVDYTAWAWGQVDGIIDTFAADEWLRHVAGGDRWHLPHSYDQRNIMQVGRPAAPGPGDTPWRLDRTGLSADAVWFLDLLGDLTVEGWASLCGFPQGGWPHAEIVDRIIETVPRAAVLVPIDIRGMATDRNPEGIYW